MTALVNSTYISLDGVIQNPQDWPDTGGFGPEGNKLQTDMVLSSGALLMGRHTYDAFAAVWPTRTGDPLTDTMNAMPKYVASTTLTDPTWHNTHVLEGDLVVAVRLLKEQLDGDIVQFGFGQVTHALLAAGLLDRLRLWVHPFLIGRGGPADLLYRDTPTTAFDLDEATTLDSGIVVLDYRVSQSATQP
jgi:dihydrofolate reductase